MPVTIVGTPFDDVGIGGSFTLTNGSRPGRGVVVIAYIRASGSSIPQIIFDGATGGWIYESSDLDQQEAIAYFTDAQLPASAGTYVVDDIGLAPGCTYTVIEIDGWDQQTPLSLAEVLTAEERPTADSTISFTGTGADGFIALALTKQFGGSALTFEAGATVHQSGEREALVTKLDSAGDRSIDFNVADFEDVLYAAALFEPLSSGPDYTARKGSTETITHTLTADGITTATLNGETVTIGTQSGQDADIDLDETAITTSGEYDLVLGDGVGTETFTVQYNVIGLPSNTLLKDGAALASLTDVKLTVLDASGTRLDRQTGLTTDASGLTGVTPVAAGAVDDPVEVSFFSPGSEVGIVYETTLELL